MHGSLPTKLRVLRAERGLTLRAAEHLTGVDKDTLSKIERGRRAPHDVTLAKIAKGYGIPVEDLLEEPVPLAEARPETERPPVYISAASGSAEGAAAGLTVGDALAQLEQLAVQFRAGEIAEEEADREMR